MRVLVSPPLSEHAKECTVRQAMTIHMGGPNKKE